MKLIDYVASYPESHNTWNWYELSTDPNITFDDILAYPKFINKWDTFSFFKNERDRSPFPLQPETMNKWEWRQLSENLNVTVDDVLSHPEFINKWEWRQLSKNPNITLNDVLAHPELMEKWNWYELFQNPNFTLEQLLDYPELMKKWNQYRSSGNFSATLKNLLDSQFSKTTKWDLVVPPQDNYVKLRLLSSLDSPHSKLCMTMFEL